MVTTESWYYHVLKEGYYTRSANSIVTATIVTNAIVMAVVVMMTYFGAPVRVPASNDMTVLLPTPCFPTTPTTRKSLCSNIYWERRRRTPERKIFLDPRLSNTMGVLYKLVRTVKENTLNTAVMGDVGTN